MAKSTVPGSVWELLPKAGPPSPLLQAAKAAIQAAAKVRRRMARRRGACRVSGFTVLKLPETNRCRPVCRIRALQTKFINSRRKLYSFPSISGMSRGADVGVLRHSGDTPALRILQPIVNTDDLWG